MIVPRRLRHRQRTRKRSRRRRRRRRRRRGARLRCLSVEIFNEVAQDFVPPLLLLLIEIEKANLFHLSWILCREKFVFVFPRPRFFECLEWWHSFVFKFWSVRCPKKKLSCRKSFCVKWFFWFVPRFSAMASSPAGQGLESIRENGKKAHFFILSTMTEL